LLLRTANEVVLVHDNVGGIVRNVREFREKNCPLLVLIVVDTVLAAGYTAFRLSGITAFVVSLVLAGALNLLGYFAITQVREVRERQL
jgi:tetrahydromethanopterin S-methyltransferase subunit F